MKTEQEIKKESEGFYKEYRELQDFLSKNVIGDEELFYDLERRRTQCINKHMALEWVLEN